MQRKISEMFKYTLQLFGLLNSKFPCLRLVCNKNFFSYSLFLKKDTVTLVKQINFDSVVTVGCICNLIYRFLKAYRFIYLFKVPVYFYLRIYGINMHPNPNINVLLNSQKRQYRITLCTTLQQRTIKCIKDFEKSTNAFK